ncbi:MAG: hypothetical protein DMF22_02395 [Verrucomicrobia bacterium]|nr:MAG: hypothetical protein DME81_07275 [Verrucomicrobiota bacterium]PYJ50636.1 MAG: hypothetical protein DME83_09110 [Verrucomicrobiota bacterium]PYL73106.1 MAG: hypothetical protein DMF22_02395 [Verrucomicrobiota bacterium]
MLFLAKEIEKGLADFGRGHDVDLTIKLPERPKISKWKSRGALSCAAGYRSAENKNPGQKKVRFARTDVIHVV